MKAKLITLFHVLVVSLGTMIAGNLYEIDFTTGQGEWTIEDKELNGITYVWTQTSDYGMKASAYADEAHHESESWLISPVIDLQNIRNAKLKFSHTQKYANSSLQLSVYITLDGTTWTRLDWGSLSNWPMGDSWNFIIATFDLSSYTGNSNVQIAFVYTSTTSAAATWEIKRVQVEGDVVAQFGDLYYNLNKTDHTAEVTYQDEIWSENNYAGLTSAVIPESIEVNSITYAVTGIETAAFSKCTTLTSVSMPNTITDIGPYSFEYCSLTSVDIPNSVTSIGNGAFKQCAGLTTITIPNNITSIGTDEGAFSGCSNIVSVIWNAKNCSNTGGFGSQVESFTFGNGVETIPDSCCDGMNRLTTIIIPNSVTSIKTNAFRECTGLTSINIPYSVTRISNEAFSNCTNLLSVMLNSNAIVGASHEYLDIDKNLITSMFGKQVTTYILGNNVTSIGKNAFYWCSGMTSIMIPSSVTSIEDRAFYGCSNLTNIYVPCDELERFQTLLNNDSRVKYEPLPFQINILSAEGGSVIYPTLICDKMELEAIPNYGYHFVQWSDGVKDNPRSFELTQDTTFKAEFNLDRTGTCGTELALTWSYDATAKTLTISGEGAFDDNMQCGVEARSELKNIIFNKGVTSIGTSAFANCATLQTLVIGEDVKKINENAFYNCENLTAIYNYRATPSNAYSTAFDGVDKFECTLYVLAGSMELYQNASVWRDFYYKKPLGATETTTTDNEVKVEPSDNTVTLTWPTENDAASYTIEITKDGAVICTLIFNANGQLTGIAFAPSRSGTRRAPAATLTTNGMQFTVTGLNSGTDYAFNLTAKDATDAVIASYSGTFKTTGTATGVEEINSSNTQTVKLLKQGNLYILRDGEMYNAQGVRVE